MAPIGAKLRENAFQMIPDISMFDIQNIKILRFVRKLWATVYPSRIAPIVLKLGQNAFQTIPNISYFDPRNFFWGEHFWPQMCFFVRKKHTPFFGELRQASQYMFDSDSDSNDPWDVCLNSLKSGFWIFGFLLTRSECLRVLGSKGLGV